MLISDLVVRMVGPALTSDLLIKKELPTLTSNHVGAYNHIRKAQHDRTLLSSVKRIQHLHLTYSSERHALTSDLVGTKSYTLIRMACTHI